MVYRLILFVVLLLSLTMSAYAQTNDPDLTQEITTLNGGLSYSVPADWVLDEDEAAETFLIAASDEVLLDRQDFPKSTTGGFRTRLSILNPVSDLETSLLSHFVYYHEIYYQSLNTLEELPTSVETTFLNNDALILSTLVTNGEESSYLYVVGTQIGNAYIVFEGVAGSEEEAIDLFPLIQDTVEINTPVLTQALDYTFRSEEVTLFDGGLSLLLPAGLGIDTGLETEGMVFIESEGGLREMLSDGERPDTGFTGSIMVFQNDNPLDRILNEELGSLGYADPPRLNDLSTGDVEIVGYSGRRRIPEHDIDDFWHESYAVRVDDYVILYRFDWFQDDFYRTPFSDLVEDAVADPASLASFLN